MVVVGEDPAAEETDGSLYCPTYHPSVMIIHYPLYIYYNHHAKQEEGEGNQEGQVAAQAQQASEIQQER